MNHRSIFYRFPRLYIWGLKQLHQANFDRRYRYMAGQIRPGESVLEPGCGPAILPDYLPAGSYAGFDANQAFLDFALAKGRRVFLGNVFDRKNYAPTDAIVVCDVLHHLAPAKRQAFVRLCFDYTKRLLIICEPQSPISTGNDWLRPLKNRLAEWSERDGTNEVKVNYFFTAGQLKRLIKDGFGIIPGSIKRTSRCFGEDIVVTFFKHD